MYYIIIIIIIKLKRISLNTSRIVSRRHKSNTGISSSHASGGMAEILERTEEVSAARAYLERMYLTSVIAFDFQEGLAAKKYGIQEAITAVLTRGRSEVVISNSEGNTHQRQRRVPLARTAGEDQHQHIKCSN
jgi:hypothetical protein